jgi:hypothetical protein
MISLLIRQSIFLQSCQYALMTSLKMDTCIQHVCKKNTFIITKITCYNCLKC